MDEEGLCEAATLTLDGLWESRPLMVEEDGFRDSTILELDVCLLEEDGLLESAITSLLKSKL